MKTRTRIGTWNVLTLAQQGKLAQLANEASRLKLEILGLSEVRWPNTGEHKTPSGQVLLYSGIRGENATRERGVGFLLSPQAHAALMRWEPVNERIIVARFRTRVRSLTMIQCYAPTDAADLQVKESFYSQLNSVVEKVPKGDIQIHLGDFNAKIGSNNADLERVMGRHGLGEMSENGELLTEFCGNNNMVIGGSLFPHRPAHKVTWVSRDGRTENQIDHICISRKWRRSLLDVRNKRSADIASDHHLVVAEIRLRVARILQREEKVGCRYDTRRLENAEVKRAFVEQLEARASELPPGGTVEEQWTNIKNAYITTSDETLGKLRSGRREWISDETWRIINERREAKASIERARTRAAKTAARQRYAELEKAVKRSCRRDKRAWTNSLAEEGERAAANGDIRLLYDISRRLSGVRTNARMPLKDRAGQLLTDRTDQLKRWAEHFEQLFQVSNVVDQETQQRAAPTVRRISRVNSDAPTLAEIVAAIKSMKSNKAPGIDCITAEMLKADPILSAQMLHQLFGNIWETVTFPVDWMQGILVKVPKKGDLTECGNWRGITLLCISLKVLCKVILNRIQEKIDATLRRQQAGFRPGRSCVDHIATLRIILEQVNEFQDSLLLVFVDFEKAFDRLNHENIWSALRRRGVPEKLVHLIEAQYEAFTCKVLHDGVLSDHIRVTAGVRQGCLLSPLLFLIVMDEILVGAIDSRPNRGLPWNPLTMEHLNDLDLADDIILLAQRRADMQSKVDDLCDSSKAAGLIVNVAKTKSMVVNTNNPSNFTVAGEQVEEVECFQYLGSQTTPDGGTKTDIATRIRKARGVFAGLRKVWRSGQISLHTKLRIFNSNVKSVLLYACETWCVATDTTQKLQVFVNRCLRYIIRAWWPHNWISNSDLHRRCHQRPITTEIRERKWRWIGHTLRRGTTEICREALEWNPQGQRRRGRPRGSWRRSVVSEIQAADPNLSWNQVKSMARNRRQWSVFKSSLCSVTPADMDQ